MSSIMASIALSVLPLLTLVVGYSFEITTPPVQCGPLSLHITNGSGIPPYEALIIPFGPSPGPTEQRTVIQQRFYGSSTNFTMRYPKSASFVVMVSDSNGIGTGGTSIPIIVGASDDSSCLPSNVSVLFSFEILPNNAINQCQQTTIAWDKTAQGNVTFSLVIPGGKSSSIPIVNPVPSGPSGPGGVISFQWTPNVRAATTILLLAGDSRGPGTGGSVNTAVGNNPNQDSSCLNNDSPSSTPGTPAGAVQTGTPTGNGSSGSGSANAGGGTNIGAIIGGVVGAVAALAILGLLARFVMQRRRYRRRRAGHDVDLLPNGMPRDHDQTPDFLQPEPYIVPPQSHTDAEGNDGSSVGRPSMSDFGPQRYSALSTTDRSDSLYDTTTGPGSNFLAAGAASTSRSTSYAPGSTRKSPMGPPQLRPVNFVQHEDAGEVPEAGGSGQQDEPETIELPPSYASVRKD